MSQTTSAQSSTTTIELAENLAEKRLETRLSTNEDRRNGPLDRRIAAEDRRNAERLMDDFSPRRNPDSTDRRLR